MVIRIGSLSPAKVEGVRDALAAIATVDPRFRAATLQPVDVGDVAPTLPMSLEETIDGARRRADAAMRSGPADFSPDDDRSLAIGIEAGIATIRTGPDDIRALVTWAAATDGRRWVYGGGGTIVLPDGALGAVARGEALGDVIDRLAGRSIRSTHGAWGLLTGGLEDRRAASRTAVLAALAPFYNPALYRA